MSDSFVVQRVTIRVECMARPKKKTKLGVDGDLPHDQFPSIELSHEVEAILGDSPGSVVLSVEKPVGSQPRDWFRDEAVFPFTVDEALQVIAHSQWVKLRFEVDHDGQVLVDTIGYEIDADQPDEAHHATEKHEFVLKQTVSGLELSFPDDPGGGAVSGCTDLRAALAVSPQGSWLAELFRSALTAVSC
jgi:hypothetical protein